MIVYLVVVAIAAAVSVLILVIGAGARTWVGVVNFVVLQWFGVRIARVVERQPIPGDPVAAWLHREGGDEARAVVVDYRLLRWVWPLTGWWSSYRWIRTSRRLPLKPSLAIAVLRAAGLPQPLPRGFMRLLDRDGREVDIPCLADEWLPAHSLWHLDPYNDGRVTIAAHPGAWAEVGARNLAAAHRPEGIR